MCLEQGRQGLAYANIPKPLRGAELTANVDEKLPT